MLLCTVTARLRLECNAVIRYIGVLEFLLERHDWLLLFTLETDEYMQTSWSLGRKQMLPRRFVANDKWQPADLNDTVCTICMHSVASSDGNMFPFPSKNQSSTNCDTDEHVVNSSDEPKSAQRPTIMQIVKYLRWVQGGKSVQSVLTCSEIHSCLTTRVKPVPYMSKQVSTYIPQTVMLSHQPLCMNKE